MTTKRQKVLKKFGSVLRQRRIDLNLTQEALAAKIGIDRTYISGLERGLRNPTLIVLVKVSAALGLSVSQLLTQIR